MRPARSLKIVLATLYVAGVSAALVARYTPLGCGALGGRWGSAAGVCITPMCHYLSGCGEWTHPLADCSSLHVGMPESRLHFLLGDPSHRAGATMHWEYVKDRTVVTATIRAGTAAELSCYSP